MRIFADDSVLEITYFTEAKMNNVCFIGHRKITKTENLIKSLNETIEKLITNDNASVFLFGSRSDFNDLCYEAVTTLKEKYPHIKRVFVRAEYPHISEDYRNYLLESYEDTYYSDKLLNAGRSVYVERNYDMIDKCAVCVFYYDENYLPNRRMRSKKDLFDYQPKSGTGLAYNYAVQKKKQIINLFEKI